MEEKNTEVKKCMPIFQEDQDGETDYGLKGYNNTESRACTNKNLNLSRNSLFMIKKSLTQLKRNNLIKENKIKAKEFNIGSNKVVLEMNEKNFIIQGQQGIATASKLKLGDKQLTKKKGNNFYNPT